MGPQSKKRCHLDCVVDPGRRAAVAKVVPAGLVEKMQALVKDSPELTKRDSTVRLCNEDLRLTTRGQVCSRSPSPPPELFLLSGLVEVRISSCALTSVPPEVGRLQGLRSLVLLSLQLRSIPEEVGDIVSLEQIFLNGNFIRRLPRSVAALPNLTDVCLDANRFEALPAFASQKLKTFTTPGNSLRAPPEFAKAPARLEVHGNRLQSLSSAGDWSQTRSIKAMGNQLRLFPDSLAAKLQWIEYLNLADNCLTRLPEEVASMTCLEWIHLYNNRLTDLPVGLARAPKLKRLLVEGNPLKGDCLAEIVQDAKFSDIQTLAIDDDQVRTMLGHLDPKSTLPACVTGGELIKVQGSRHSQGMYLKLTRASQLRRTQGLRLAGTPGGPATCAAAPARTLVVAFAASQGEPEWLGVLRGLADGGTVAAARSSFPPPSLSLQEFLGDGAKADTSRFCPLWKPSQAGSEMSDDGQAIEDFDVLVCCDGRMRWYAEDAAEVTEALATVCERYAKKLFIGASMGGYAALLHGGKLADAVLAFGPQVQLFQAVLRPPADDVQALEAKCANVQEAVRLGRARGARIEVHCAADTHLEHAMALPLADSAMTVHPLLPRTPFARLLERGGVLWSIVASAMVRLEEALPLTAARVASGEPAPRACVAHWGDGRCSRYWATREEVMEFFFGPDAPKLPRPGDWFCSTCCARNMKTQFFCTMCGGKATNNDWSNVPTMIDPGACGVATSGGMRRGDWGCGGCGQVNQGRDRRCSHCKNDWNDHRNVVVK